ncbi:hypothetical protein DFH09DRAFT_1326113 [Mycena vulgaris]|nr:hypothetical protein DFH09DRAFT_1326113 [Mycena vulgaris]
MPFPVFSELSANGSDNPDGLWFLTMDGFMTHDYKWAFEVQESDPHIQRDPPGTEPSDFPTFTASSLAVLARSLPHCHGMSDIFKRRADGTIEQLGAVYFVVRGKRDIFTSMYEPIATTDLDLIQPCSTDVERAFEDAGDYWGTIYASHSLDEAEFHAEGNIFVPLGFTLDIDEVDLLAERTIFRRPDNTLDIDLLLP